MIHSENRFHFPDYIKRVTAGPGGEALLVLGSEKTALIDCGMAFCGMGLVENIKRELEVGRTLNYIFLTHTHYDHIGGLPYLKQAWPASISVGSPHAKRVLERPGALQTIRELSLAAGEMFQKSNQRHEDGLQPGNIKVEYQDSDVTVDRVVTEGDLIGLGNITFRVINTQGHTDCSISFYHEEERVLFASESIGCLTPDGEIMLAMLKGYQDTVCSIEKGRQLNPDCIIISHYGMIPEAQTQDYWNYAREAADNYRDFVLHRHRAGLSEGEIYDQYQEEYWHSVVRNQQPLEAFEINGRQIIKAIIGEDMVI